MRMKFAYNRDCLYIAFSCGAALYTTCVSVCLSVCLPVCVSPKYSSSSAAPARFEAYLKLKVIFSCIKNRNMQGIKIKMVLRIQDPRSKDPSFHRFALQIFVFLSLSNNFDNKNINRLKCHF